MADIDLLIREEDLEEAERRLRSIGYEAAHDPQTKEELRRRHHHWVFRSARPGAGDIPIELHWNLDPPGRPAAWDIPALFERAEAARSREPTPSCSARKTSFCTSACISAGTDSTGE